MTDLTPTQTRLIRDILHTLSTVEVDPTKPDDDVVACVTGNPPRMVTAGEVRQARAITLGTTNEVMM